MHPWGGGEDGGLPGTTEGGLPDIEDLTGGSPEPGEAYRAARQQLGLEAAPQHHHDDGPDVSGWRERMGV